jgi:hypothetical protein
VLVVIKTANDEAILFIFEVFPRVPVEDDDGLVDLSNLQDHFLDIFQLRTDDFIDDALEKRLHVIFFISEEKQEISILILHVLGVN